jgi:uncharacterized delta-60 repeat protein
MRVFAWLAVLGAAVAGCTTLLNLPDVPPLEDGGTVGDAGSMEAAAETAIGDVADAGAVEGGPACPSGMLDPSFAGGEVKTPIGTASAVRAVMVLPNGSVLAAGTSDTAFALAKYGSDGGLDPTFGDAGVTTVPIGTSVACFGAALQPDGRSVLVGASTAPDAGGKTVFAVARFTTQGMLDPSFGGGGTVTTDFGGAMDSAQAVAIQPDGKIVVVGTSVSAGSAKIAIARFGGDGSRDTGFGGSNTGTATTMLTGADYGRAVALRADGKIVVAGVSGAPGGPSMVLLVRYRADGTLDLDNGSAFGFGGYVLAPFQTMDQSSGLTFDAAGRIVVAGQAAAADAGAGMDGGSSSYLVARFDDNGARDDTFGDNGGVFVPIGTMDTASAVVTQSDGKIVALGGTSTTPGKSQFALARLLADGGLDQGFGASGVVTTAFAGNDVGYAVALQADGRIVAGGYAAAYAQPGSVFALSRYCP